jgi:Na+/melibiose symporter-like transporter
MTGSIAPEQKSISQGITAFDWHDGWRYGLMGLPLAFVALPLYVLLPNHYARAFGMPLATLGALLLGARLFDALIDPLLGRWSDRLFARAQQLGSLRWVLSWAAGAAVVLGGGFSMLFFPQVSQLAPLLVWAAISLTLTYAAYSLLTIMHQSWGAMLGGDESQRSRIVAWREGMGLLGVILASVSPMVVGMGGTTGLFFLALALGWWGWTQARQPPAADHAAGPTPEITRSTTQATSQAKVAAEPADEPVDAPHSSVPLARMWLPFHRGAFRALLAVFVVNGIASAVPATLILFFVQDRLQAPEQMQPLFLGSYFVFAALAIPLWLKVVQRLGLARTWALGMLLAVVVFSFAMLLGAGDIAGFWLVCALAGVALGTDLALPGAMLAGVIQGSGDRGLAEGAYFGWWNFATKLNLALAAGVALPVLGLLGYTPGAQDPQALQTLAWAYCLLPCVLKLVALGLLYFLIIRKTP